MAATTCDCVCHRHGSLGPHIMPALDDPIETIMACSQCRWRHFPPLPYTPPASSAYDPTGDTE